MLVTGRILEEDADVDEDVAAVLKGTGGDPDRIRANMRAAMQVCAMFT
jgi:hypothetical protein